jgi:hypothetical protein
MIDWIIDHILAVVLTAAGLLIAALVVMAVVAGSDEPQPYIGQERHQVYACHPSTIMMPIVTGKTTIMVPQQQTQCDWEDIPQ